MTTEQKMCSAYDQIAGRRCRYYAGHGGRHHFARLDHDCSLERELRRELDERTSALAEAIDLFDASWCTEQGHAPKPEQFRRIDDLREQLTKSEPKWRDLYARNKTQ